MHELIYTSAPGGLDPNAHGFCTVARTRDLPRRDQLRLEGLCGYDPAFPLSDPRADSNPAAISHLRLSNPTRHVLSRVGFAGADHTGRSNKLAHHLLLDPSERPLAGPAWTARALASTFCQTFTEDPHERDPARLPDVTEPAVLLPQRWEDACGHGAWAGAFARHRASGSSAPFVLIVPLDLDPLDLFVESLHLLPPSERWSVSFTTYDTGSLPPDASCSLRAVLDGTPAAQRARAHPRAVVLDLTRPLPELPADRFSDAAHTGRPPAREVTVPNLEPTPAPRPQLQPTLTLRPVTEPHRPEPLPTAPQPSPAWDALPWLIGAAAVLVGVLAVTTQDTPTTLPPPRIERPAPPPKPVAQRPAPPPPPVEPPPPPPPEPIPEPPPPPPVVEQTPPPPEPEPAPPEPTLVPLTVRPDAAPITSRHVVLPRSDAEGWTWTIEVKRLTWSLVDRLAGYLHVQARSGAVALEDTDPRGILARRVTVGTLRATAFEGRLTLRFERAALPDDMAPHLVFELRTDQPGEAYLLPLEPPPSWEVAQLGVDATLPTLRWTPPAERPRGSEVAPEPAATFPDPRVRVTQGTSEAFAWRRVNGAKVGVLELRLRDGKVELHVDAHDRLLHERNPNARAQWTADLASLHEARIELLDVWGIPRDRIELRWEAP